MHLIVRIGIFDWRPERLSVMLSNPTGKRFPQIDLLRPLLEA
jgi:hypothetical protein